MALHPACSIAAFSAQRLCRSRPTDPPGQPPGPSLSCGPCMHASALTSCTCSVLPHPMCSLAAALRLTLGVGHPPSNSFQHEPSVTGLIDCARKSPAGELKVGRHALCINLLHCLRILWDDPQCQFWCFPRGWALLPCSCRAAVKRPVYARLTATRLCAPTSHALCCVCLGTAWCIGARLLR